MNPNPVTETLDKPADVLEPRREDLLLAAMADQQNEFARFRENVADRLSRLEKRERRSLLDIEPEKVFDYVVFAIAAFFAVRLALYLFSQFKTSGGNREHLPLPQAR